MGHHLLVASAALGVEVFEMFAFVVIEVLKAQGVAVEFAQAMTPYRSFDTHDMFANCIGAIAGLTLALLWQRYKSI